MTTAALLAPRDQEEACRLVREAAEAGRKLAPVGAGSRGWLGRPGPASAIAIGTACLDRIVHYEPDDLTITVEAGIAFEKLQHHLAERGQWLPVNPPGGAQSTLGGLLATGIGGSLRSRYGSWRDLVLGMTVVLGTGELAKSGGRVVKNVAGYDLHKLHIGALGTLGLIAQVSLKVLPLPAERRLFLAEFPAAAQALDAARQAAASQLEPAGVEVLFGGRSKLASREKAPFLLGVRLAGPAESCARAVRDVAALARRAGATELADIDGADCDEAWTALDEAPGDGRTIARVTAPPERVIALAAARQGGDGETLAADIATGTAHVIWEDELDPETTSEHLARLRGEVGANGSVILLKGSPQTRANTDVWGSLPPAYPVMLAIKRALDPRGLWNPGRYLGEL